MAVDFTTNHADANVSKLLATNYGGHIYNVTLSSAADNGNIVKRGAYNSFDNYAEAQANNFNGIVRGQAANGKKISKLANKILSVEGKFAFGYNCQLLISDEYKKSSLLNRDTLYEREYRRLY